VQPGDEAEGDKGMQIQREEAKTVNFAKQLDLS
jgi:hypothetical protein